MTEAGSGIGSLNELHPVSTAQRIVLQPTAAQSPKPAPYHSTKYSLLQKFHYACTLPFLTRYIY